MTNPIRLTPLHSMAERLGATWIELSGWRFAKYFSSIEQEIAAVRAGCGLADVSPHGKVQIEGAQAAQALTAALGSAPERIGAHAGITHGLYRLRADLFYLSTPPGGEVEACQRIEAAAAQSGHFVTVTNLTDGLADLRIIGPRAAEVMSRVCGLDFDDSVFPDQTAKQSSLAKTRQLIIRRDFGPLRAYTTIGARSLAAYVWSVLLEAGQAFGMTPVGVGALRELEIG